jgi:two-component system phosphate regulon sensor histidine kinase PhoR
MRYSFSRHGERALGWRTMKIGIRLKLLLVSLALIALSLGAGALYLIHAVDRELTTTKNQDLSVRAELVAREASAVTASLDDTAAWDDLADRLGTAAHARVTFIRTDGVVIGDSELALTALPSLENHSSRPEVAAARAEGHGSSVRFSTTLRQRMMYVAIPFEHDGKPAGVARVAEPLRSVDEAISHVERLVGIASLFAIVLAFVMSSIASGWMSRIVRDLTEAARRMAAGDLDVRTHVRTSDELGELGRALDQLADSLSTTLRDLRDERDLQRRILDGMQEGVLVLDRDSRLVMVNPSLRQMLLLGADAKGKLLMEVVRHADLHELVKKARAGRTTALGEIDLPGIKPRRLLIHATALPGEIGGLLAVFVDVTDLRRLESLRRDFVANVSHELRTPVTAVRSAAETLKVSALRDPDPSVADRFVEIIERNAERLQSLIEDLLELSRLESKEFRLKRERIELGVVASIVQGLFRERADKKRIHLATEIASDLPPIHTDQRALEQVLSNLVENAVKYCPLGSTVTIGARLEKGGVRVSVSDNGPGIDPKHVPRLFERFYRVDAGRSREVGGTGLGLSIVKHLVEAMGGAVTVDSKVGKGSTFVVTLPQAV